MRVLTISPTIRTGLIDILEADENAAQIVYFCIPIDKYEAENIKTVSDFGSRFANGIVTKIKINGEEQIVKLNYGERYLLNNENRSVPFFYMVIDGVEVGFDLSILNFESDPKSKTGISDYFLNIQFFYAGNLRNESLGDKKLVILEANWKTLDKIFLYNNVLMVDWEF